MGGSLALAKDYFRRSRMRVRAVEALIEVCDPPDAVHDSHETVELAIRSLIQLSGLPCGRHQDPASFMRGPEIERRLLGPSEVQRVEEVARRLRRDCEPCFYGDETVVPLDHYSLDDARVALQGVLEVIELVGRAFERCGIVA